MMFSKSHNKWHRRIGDREAADHLRHHDKAAWNGNNTTEIGDNAAGSAITPRK